MQKLNKIIIYDKSPALSGIEMAFKSADHKVTAADSYDKLLALLKQEQFDVLLADIPHWEIDDSEETEQVTIKELRTIHAQYPSLPLITVSTTPLIENWHQRLKEDIGAVLSVYKPVGTDEFNNLLAKALQRP